MKINRVVVWGLKNRRNSFRYIFESFFKAFKSMDLEVLWVDDDLANQDLINSGSLVFAMGLSIRYLPVRSDCFYVLHNVEDERFFQQGNFIRLQVWTRDSKGSLVDESIALYSHTESTLYQPWGICEERAFWLPPNNEKKRKEFWIGSVWNNNSNQGNAAIMMDYRELLKEKGITFKRLGGTRSFFKSGVPPQRALALVHISPYGSAIVGKWQEDSGYVPCRIFKNVAAGKLPSSNGNYANIFGHAGLFDASIESLLDRVDEISSLDYKRRVLDAQSNLEPYTYRRNICRILDLAGLKVGGG